MVRRRAGAKGGKKKAPYGAFLYLIFLSVQDNFFSHCLPVFGHDPDIIDTVDGFHTIVVPSVPVHGMQAGIHFALSNCTDALSEIIVDLDAQISGLLNIKRNVVTSH